MRQRFDAGSILVAVAATLLLISLFLDWFSPGLSAWGAFEVVDVLLAALAVGAIVLALADPTDSDGDAPRRLPILCGAALVLVASQVIDAPPAAGDGREAGLWLALGATLVMALASLLTAARISVLVDVQERDRRRRVAAVDRRDALGAQAGDGADAPGGSLQDASPGESTQAFSPVAEPGSTQGS